ncbi:hypothetical protein AAG570_004898 [Ranatra chinensis]|uniref:Uncharacterized protein n=1 Tax=Ranatra chinensis TaxID=642074 RepID=A0ABD0XYW1_9HEMI
MLSMMLLFVALDKSGENMLPIGLLALRRWSSGGGGGGGKWDQRHAVRSAVRVTAEAIKRAAATVIGRISTDALTPRQWNGPTSCWNPAPPANITLQLVKPQKLVDSPEEDAIPHLLE